MIRILHAADLHLDSPFESLPEEKAALRRSEQRALLRSLAQLRAETGAELVLLSVWLREDFLVDVALVFALLSFLAVVVVSRLVAARRRKRPEREKTGGNAHDR